MRAVLSLGCQAERGPACRTPKPALAPLPSPPHTPLLPAALAWAGKAPTQSGGRADPKLGWNYQVPQVFPSNHRGRAPAIPEPQNDD